MGFLASLLQLLLYVLKKRAGNIAVQKKTYAHDKKWDANKKNPKMWLEGNASLFSRDIS